MGVVGIDFERQIERSARSNDPKILIEHNERFSNRVDDSMRKYPSIPDLGELFSEHVSEHEHGDTCVGARVCRTLSPRHAQPLPKMVSTIIIYVRSATQFGALKRAKPSLCLNNRRPLGVQRVTLNAPGSLPVYRDRQTFSESVGMSQRAE